MILEQQLLTVKQAAIRLNVSEKTIRRMIKREELNAIVVSFSYRIEESEIERIIRERSTKGE